MHALSHALTLIRNLASSIFTRTAGFWLVNVLIAVIIPSPVAAPVLYARLRRARRGAAAPAEQHVRV